MNLDECDALLNAHGYVRVREWAWNVMVMIAGSWSVVVCMFIWECFR